MVGVRASGLRFMASGFRVRVYGYGIRVRVLRLGYQCCWYDNWKRDYKLKVGICE